MSLIGILQMLDEVQCFKIIKQRGSTLGRSVSPTGRGDLRIEGDRLAPPSNIQPGDLVGSPDSVTKQRAEDQIDLFRSDLWLRRLQSKLLMQARLVWARRRRDVPATLYLVMKKKNTDPIPNRTLGRPILDEGGRIRVKKSISIAASTDDFLRYECRATGKKAGQIIDIVVAHFNLQRTKK